ncbi:TfuA-like protein [Micromonospora sp. WMMD882]|uniref:TfuA-like protein n=1 Tax=Micromonospora sp. WMMD882 TaxID=3015151 RepID=UPI00248B04BB|nr:TfuA-like protein [Micromonospora sp. WMMD882]WBB77321.1 TfuA-like protein [Micromonospora sp. WMMD882]
MATHVFAGPTIGADDIRRVVPDAVTHPPVRHGDLLRLRPAAADTVLILDGLFFQAPAVRHKEILHLVRRGVRVVGASSMGALRAAELHPYGVVGVGQVFQWYADGTVTADDEVAVVHLDDDGHAQLSDALVSIRYGLRAATGEALAPDEANGLLALVRDLPFPRRSWSALWRMAEQHGLADAARRARGWLDVHPDQRDVKRLDALRALRLVRDGRPVEVTPVDVSKHANLDTVYLADWRWENEGVELGGRLVTDQHTLAFLQLFLPAYPSLHRRVTLDAIARDGTPEGDDDAGATLVERALGAARARRLLGPDGGPTAGMREWLSSAEQAALPDREIVVRALVRSFRTEPGIRAGHRVPSLLTGQRALLRLARTCAAAAGAVNETATRRNGEFRVEHIRHDLVETFFRNRWGCADLEVACWDRGLTGLAQLHELGRYFLLLARSGKLPEETLNAVPTWPDGQPGRPDEHRTADGPAGPPAAGSGPTDLSRPATNGR